MNPFKYFKTSHEITRLAVMYYVRRVYELKPLSNREGPLRARAESPVNSYVALSTGKPLGNYSKGEASDIITGNESLTVSYLGVSYRIRFHLDKPENRNSGLIFYTAERVGNVVGDVVEDVIEEVCENPVILIPPLPGRPRPPRPIPTR